jgi:transcriptional regulator with PAS, ATPase and Fis domain
MTDTHFQNILEAIKDPAILIDREYRICAANQSYIAAFGQAPIGSSCYETSHDYSEPCDKSGEDCPLKNCLLTNTPQRVLHIHNTSSGKEHIDVELSPIHNEQGQITHFVEVMRQANTTVFSNRKMLGYSRAFSRMLDLLHRAAKTDISVLLQGETGCGKELAAHYLHEHSSRHQKPFVIVECSGLSETLFESELFGHEKGAFTGAITRKTGLVEAAEGGTLFLDEIGDVPLSLQVKLLRLLETRKYRRVGGVSEISADFRLVCATHKSLQAMVSRGEFRKDLYFRICPFPVKVPALKERKSDIPLIARHLLEAIDQSHSFVLSAEAEQWLMQYDFPGNVRELRNILERAVILCDQKTLFKEHLQSDLIQEEDEPDAFEDSPLKTLAEAEADYLKNALHHFKGDNHALALALGISERTLYRKINRLTATG